MATLMRGIPTRRTFCDGGSVSVLGASGLPLLQPREWATEALGKGRIVAQSSFKKHQIPCFSLKGFSDNLSKKAFCTVTRCSNSPKSNDSLDDSPELSKVGFGYSRKDVLLIGVGVMAVGVGLKYGLELFGVDPLLAGNVVQLVIVLGLVVGWILTYLFRVSNKEMTYAQQLRDYENKVMQKRLEGLTEGELEALLEQVEEEKRRVAAARGKQQESHRLRHPFDQLVFLMKFQHHWIIPFEMSPPREFLGGFLFNSCRSKQRLHDFRWTDFVYCKQ